VCDAFSRSGAARGTIEALTEANATERNFKDKVRQYAQQIGFLHVAAHGLVSQNYNNLFGAIVLTPPDRPTTDDDGFLSLYEVFGLQLSGCEMVVLSACDTNSGPENPLEAGSTLARAFICAGAQRVVCSHWGADDGATTELISNFMRQVSEKRSANQAVDFAQALHAAKLSLKANEKMRSPYFWAPFVLIGPPSDARFGDGERAVAAD
jgi:CHAT domain-containing protein